MSGQFIPVDRPAYALNGDWELVLLAEYSRLIYVNCWRCNRQLGLKFLSDELVPDEECDRALDDHLVGMGWGKIDGADTCPDCL